MNQIKVGKESYIGEGAQTYIIAEIGSNFDGSLERAKKLIDLAAGAGADCVKFQSFKAPKIVSKEGFERLGNMSFQAEWDKPVYEVYSEAELPREWHKELHNHAHNNNVDFLSSPYDREAVDLLDDLGVSSFKVGSGEITNLDFLEYLAKKGKTIILSTGASVIGEIDKAVSTIRKQGNENLILLQCVTQYPADFSDANVRAMKTLGQSFDVPVGYSDHTKGSTVPIAAVTMGGQLIEKHFTDDTSREGPDHKHAMNPDDFENMVKDIRNLEEAFGSPVKEIYPSEEKTKIIQRRGLFTARKIEKGEVLAREDIDILRPQLGLKPEYIDKALGREVKETLDKGEPIKWDVI